MSCIGLFFTKEKTMPYEWDCALFFPSIIYLDWAIYFCSWFYLFLKKNWGFKILHSFPLFALKFPSLLVQKTTLKIEFGACFCCLHPTTTTNLTICIHALYTPLLQFGSKTVIIIIIIIITLYTSVQRVSVSANDHIGRKKKTQMHNTNPPLLFLWRDDDEQTQILPFFSFEEMMMSKPTDSVLQIQRTFVSLM